MTEVETLEMSDSGGGLRAEIDTSAPFESVKEAVTRFGGLGFWKPLNTCHNKPSYNTSVMHDVEEVDVATVEEQAAELEKELILNEKDALKVLKELEATKLMVEELKAKLQTEELAAQVSISTDLQDEKPSVVKEEDEEEEKENNPNLSYQKLPEDSNLVPSSAPGLILLELKQAKLNLTRTTSDLAEIRTSVETYNKKIERERISLEKTRERLKSSTSKILALEEEINKTRLKLQEPTDAIAPDTPCDSNNIMAELQRLNAEAEQFRKIGEAAKSEVMNVMLQIEETKAKIKTAEIRLVAARKMKEAAMAAEDVALAEIKALELSEKSVSGVLEQKTEQITLTIEEYSSLRRKAHDAKESSNLKVLEAMLQVEQANVSKLDIMKRVEEAVEEVKTSKQALEDALNRVEAANSAKLVVEEALRKWRSENGERRRSIQNSTKFKNPHPSHRRRDSWVLDLNGVNLVSDAAPPVLKPTLSIGQILSRKLLITEEYDSGKSSLKRKVSLGQMLGKQNNELSSAWKLEKDCDNLKKLSAKRKKFGFAKFSVLLPKQSKKKKKTTPTAR